MNRLSPIAAVVCALILLHFSAAGARGQEAIAEEVRVEASFSSGLLLRPDPAVTELMNRLELRSDATRALELEKANRGEITKLLDLVRVPRWLPFGLGGAENRVDHFFLQNYMRVDLNPRNENPLFSNK